MTTLSRTMQPSFAKFDLLTDLLDFGHNKIEILLGEACRFFCPHIALNRIDSCPQLGECGQILSSRFLFDLRLTNLTDDSDINLIDIMAFISLTGVIKQNLDIHLFLLNHRLLFTSLCLHITWV